MTLVHEEVREKEFILTCHVAVQVWVKQTGDVQDHNRPGLRRTTHYFCEGVSPPGNCALSGICRRH